MARPTEYKPEYVQKVLDYLQTCGREQTRLPKRVDVALMLDCHEETLIEWGKVHPEFSDALTRVDGFQKATLMDDGFYGGKEINANFAGFLLKANHGMIETERKQLVGADNQEIKITVLPAKKEEEE